jgi:glyoxylase-like metal-dependent hydrolase (beta-lactamase superfamily II)
VDATPAGSILPYCASIGLAPERIRWVLVTHADVDHMGGNAAFHEQVPTAAFLAHELDQDLVEDVGRIVEERYSEFAAGHGIDIDAAMKAWCHQVARAVPIDLGLVGDTDLRLGRDRTVELFATPGHSWGSLSVWDRPSRSAIVGDAVLGATVRFADGRPAFPPTYRNPEPYRSTIETIAYHHPTYLLTSHYPVMEGDGVGDFLDESRAFAMRLERLALRTLRVAETPLTTRDLIDALAPQVGEWPREAWIFLANALVGHLDEMSAYGAVTVDFGPPVRWSAARGPA